MYLYWCTVLTNLSSCTLLENFISENLHDNYFLLHYYDILLADAFLQKQTLKAQEQDITNKKTLLVHNKYSKSA